MWSPAALKHLVALSLSPRHLDHRIVNNNFMFIQHWRSKRSLMKSDASLQESHSAQIMYASLWRRHSDITPSRRTGQRPSIVSGRFRAQISVRMVVPFVAFTGIVQENARIVLEMNPWPFPFRLIIHSTIRRHTVRGPETVIK
jgi:hypothetical protein